MEKVAKKVYLQTWGCPLVQACPLKPNAKAFWRRRVPYDDFEAAKGDKWFGMKSFPKLTVFEKYK